MMQFSVVAGMRFAYFVGLRTHPRLKHALTTAPNDVAPREDDPSTAMQRRAAVAAQGLSDARLTYAMQVHQTRIEVIDRNSPLANPQRATETGIADTDALITHVPELPLMVFSADCPLVIVLDAEAPALALAHCSWRCTVAGLLPQVIDLLCTKCAARPSRLQVGIGPCAGPERYEVREDVYEAAATLPDRDACFHQRANGTMTFNLVRALTQQLTEADIPRGQILASNIDTMLDTRFYSHRAHADRARFGLLAALTT